MDATTPAPSRPREMIRKVMWLANNPAQKKPTAPSNTRPAANLRRSPLASDRRPTTTMLMAPHT
ncbi:hypothetical protein D3C85_1581310 [compost metagenome]